jgi:hypothetical protein
MKFHLAWADVISQNVLLKFVIFALTLCLLGFGLATLKLSLREPLLIERACITQSVYRAANTEHTETEIRSFLEIALSQRFDTESVADTSLISETEKLNRKKEQEELKNLGMRQRVLVNPESVQIQGAIVRLDVDRLIKTATLRMDLLFPLVLKLASTERTSSNPYGLTLQNASSLSSPSNVLGGAPGKSSDKDSEKSKEVKINEKSH